MLNRKLATGLLAIVLSSCQSLPAPEPESEITAPPAEAATETTAEEPDPATAQFELALWSAKAGKTKEAITHFEKLIELDSQYPRAHSNLGLLYFGSNNSEKANAHFLTAIEQDKLDAIAYNHLAILKRRQGEFSEAEKLYRQALEADPEYANAHLNLGILLDIYLQRLPEALERYQRFVELNDDNNEDVTKWIADIERRIKAAN